MGFFAVLILLAYTLRHYYILKSPVSLFLVCPLVFCHLLFRYVYELEASTVGGTGVSEQYVIQTPSSCPTGIQPPHSVTVLGPHSISLAWTPPGKYPFGLSSVCALLCIL